MKKNVLETAPPAPLSEGPDPALVCKYDKVKGITMFAIKLIAYLALSSSKTIKTECMRGDSLALLSIKWKPVCLLTTEEKEKEIVVT